jgi:hypothetical protein
MQQPASLPRVVAKAEAVVREAVTGGEEVTGGEAVTGGEEVVEEDVVAAPGLQSRWQLLITAVTTMAHWRLGRL